jgi:hypothetical protein
MQGGVYRMIRQGRSALRTTIIPVFLVSPKMDQTKAGNQIFSGVQGKIQGVETRRIPRKNNSPARVST